MNRPSWRCNHCHGSTRRKIRVQRRDRDVYAEVKAYVLNLLADPKLNYGFSKEDLSVDLRVREHCVEVALARLNREGLVNQPVHRYPHDNNRSTGFDYGTDSSWIGDVYTVRKD